MQQSKQEIYVIGLRNAHAMENEALSIMEPQAEKLENYPELQQMLQRHIIETRAQMDRLKMLLEGQDEDRSMLKDMAMSVMGTVTAIGNSMAPDEILKNTFGNFAFENFEIAAYKSLITLANAAGHPEAAVHLRQSLEEETAMAQWLGDNIEKVTERYAYLRAAGASAKA